LKFTLVFIIVSQIFQKNKISNFKIENLPNFELKNHQILKWYQKINPTASKSTSQDAFRIVLWKNKLR
jgi:hypothetical protein